MVLGRRPAISPSVGCSRKRFPRLCRAFRLRTVSTVRRALCEWGYIFGCPAPDFSPTEVTSCSQLAAEVKKLLGSCPSSSQEEVFAWQSIKKMLPDSCPCMELPLMEKLVEGFRRPRRSLPTGYLQFVARQAALLFPKGWDLGYEEQVLSTSPPISATTDFTRSSGGCLGSEIDHDSFLTECLSGPSRPDRAQPEAEVIVVQSSGKPRPLTKFCSDELLLRPLHKTIYNRLSRESWLSRGDVTAASLERAGFSSSRGGLLVSGDYKSATDGLSIEVAETLLRTALSNSVMVPVSVKERALSILRPFLYRLEGKGPPCTRRRVDIGEPNIGQMMGSYLSFPLLCLQNRMAFLWSSRRSGLSWKETVAIPCLINGDDILYQAGRPVYEMWLATVGELGLEVERTKTSVSTCEGSLNSTLLRFVGGYLRVVPTLRFGRLRSSEYVTNLGREFSQFLFGVRSNVRFRAGVVWYRRHLNSLRSTRLTLFELGFRGALALRLGKLFRLPCMATEEFVPPSAPVGHNVVLSSEDFVRLPADEVGDEVSRMSALETAAWKFSVTYAECKTRSVLRYCLRLSSCRRPEPLCGPVFVRSFQAAFWGGGRLTSVGKQLEEAAFSSKREVGVRSVAVPYRLILDQTWQGQLPPYTERELVGVAPPLEVCEPKKE
ncbi:RNA-dependent RNA polymerase [Erysiphe necator associated ourmia-like virus 96]|nr:RNA-dependent RNA polymerase [Erysiphe necator associated ourmia-like virus 96]